MRKYLIIGVLLVVLYAALLAGLLAAMYQPPERFGKIMRRVPRFAFLILPFKTLWMVARAGPLEVGDLAPNFSLETMDKSAERPKRTAMPAQRGHRDLSLTGEGRPPHGFGQR